nr:MAG TPA: tail assembly chaperone protein [Caudoviricetes sp.]
MEMGMSEEEFWKADPFLFNACYEKYQEHRMSEVIVRGR